MKKYKDMTPAERAAYRKKLIEDNNLLWSDEQLDRDLSRHSNYETIFVSRIEDND